MLCGEPAAENGMGATALEQSLTSLSRVARIRRISSTGRPLRESST